MTLDRLIYDETLLYRIGVSDSPRAERRATGGHAEFGIDATAPQPGHLGHADYAHHAAPAPASPDHRPTRRRTLRIHPNTTHQSPLRQRALQTPFKIYDSSQQTNVLKMTYQCKHNFSNVLN